MLLSTRKLGIKWVPLTRAPLCYFLKEKKMMVLYWLDLKFSQAFKMNHLILSVRRILSFCSKQTKSIDG